MYSPSSRDNDRVITEHSRHVTKTEEAEPEKRVTAMKDTARWRILEKFCSSDRLQAMLWCSPREAILSPQDVSPLSINPKSLRSSQVYRKRYDWELD